ncbi:Transposase DDE domain protein [Psychrobacter piechaudii]|uniref:Transposase DDE domain protein n=2 Tax=Psychrobacter piechaudii TaxID=1945521 RepID=A0A1R4GY52_9GAMM|nr:Transposase DDE domain protein [Psychrobacter piechaudii]
MGWFYGFKLHAIINHHGELLSIRVTPGNIDDREPLRQRLANDIFGKLFGDRGYVSQDLKDKLFNDFNIDFLCTRQKCSSPFRILCNCNLLTEYKQLHKIWESL